MIMPSNKPRITDLSSLADALANVNPALATKAKKVTYTRECDQRHQAKTDAKVAAAERQAKINAAHERALVDNLKWERAKHREATRMALVEAEAKRAKARAAMAKIKGSVVQ